MRLMLAICTMGLMLACEEKPDDSTGVATPTTAAEFEKALAQARCEYLDRCEVTVGPWYPSISACLEDNTYYYTDYTLYRVESENAASCLAALAGLTCAGGLAGLAAVSGCDDAVIGALAEGDCCDNRGGCGPGLSCYTDVETALRTCKADATEGQACGDGTYCADEMFCNDEGTCEQPRVSGAPCEESWECASFDCDSDLEECAEELGVKNLGDSCADFVECPGVPFGSCDGGICVANALAGEACHLDNDDDAIMCAWAYGLGCSAGQCSALPTAGQDCLTIDPCVGFDESCDVCAGSAFCDEGASKCVARGLDGDVCQLSQDSAAHSCGDDLWCNNLADGYDTGICVPTSDVSTTCD